jgi:hypothetical protein
MEADASHRHPAVKVGLAWLAQQNKVDKPQEAKLPFSVKKKQCYTCGEDIFFAARQMIGGDRWVPICPYPLESSLVILDAVTITFANSVTGPRLASTTLPGVQWLPHSVLCGLRERPSDPLVAKIWEKTAGTRLRNEEKAIEGMLRLLEDNE